MNITVKIWQNKKAFHIFRCNRISLLSHFLRLSILAIKNKCQECVHYTKTVQLIKWSSISTGKFNLIPYAWSPTTHTQTSCQLWGIYMKTKPNIREHSSVLRTVKTEPLWTQATVCFTNLENKTPKMPIKRTREKWVRWQLFCIWNF